ncbi:MAG: glycerophosphodiester phosphodiesterase family protein, partial [Thermotaleaceae bacterium]
RWFGESFTGERIPRLEEVLEFLKGKKVQLHIELKNGIVLYRSLEEKVLQAVKDYGMEEQVSISSFNHYSLLKIKQLQPSIKTGILYVAGLVAPWDYAKRIQADEIHPLHYGVQPEIVEGCSDNEIPIYTYTVNEDHDLERIAKLGVEGIITDYPDRGRAIIQSLFD